MLIVERWCWGAIKADFNGGLVIKARLDRANFKQELPGVVVSFYFAFVALHGAPDETEHLQT